MKCKLLVSIIPIVLLFNCAPSVLLNERWAPAPESGKSLAIVLADASISVDYMGDVKNEFGIGNMKSLIKSNVKAILYHNLVKNAAFHDIWFDQLSTECSKEALPPAGDSRMESKYAPPANSNIALVNRPADYVLLFYGLAIVSHGGVSPFGLLENSTVRLAEAREFPGTPAAPCQAPGPDASGFAEYSGSFEQAPGFDQALPIAQYPMPVPTMNTQMNNTSYFSPSFSKDLSVSARFVLWDVKQRCPIVHGFTKNTVSGYFTNYDNWKDIVDKTVSEILGRTGLLCAQDTVNYKFGNRSELQVVGTKDKIDLKTSRFKWLFANTITKNDIDSSDVKKIKSKSRSAEEMEHSTGNLFHFRNPRSPGAELDTVGLFTKSLFAYMREKVSKQFPSVAYCPEELQKAFQDQVLDHFSKFDYPVDTLDNATRDLARADSIDYLIVYYGRFSQSKPDDEIKSFQDNDMNFYFNLFDVRTNTTLTGYYGGFGDLFNYTNDKSQHNALNLFEIVSTAKLKSRVRL
jgi:hypothetical protein